MSAAETTADDEMAAIVSACDEALANGRLPDIDSGESETPDQARLLKGLECVRLLRAVWPQPDSTLRPQLQTIIGEPVAPESVGRFEILRELGRGGFGVVYLAFDPQLGRNVALKIPRQDILTTEHLRDRFRLEARAAAALDHPNVVAVHETGECAGVAYIAAAYCPGPSLAKHLESRVESIPFAEAAEWLAQLADGVQHAHARDILHRDLKPANVILAAIDGEKPTPKITDFGLARSLEADGDKLTITGAILGTPSYLAPEQTDHKFHSVGPAVDIYGLGAILYEVLTRRPPFQSDSALETLRQVRSDDPIPPKRLRSQIPRDLETICLKCLEKVPNQRYGSARELAADLRRFRAGETIRARPRGLWGRTARWVKRRPALSALIAVVLLMTATGLPVLAYLWRTAAADRDRAEAHLAARSIALARTAWMTEEYELARAALADCPPPLRNAEWEYLRRVCYAEVHTLTGHIWTVEAVEFSPDSLTLASVSSVGNLIISDVPTGQTRHVIKMETNRPSAVRFRPDGKSVLVVGRTSQNAPKAALAIVEVDVNTAVQRPVWTTPEVSSALAISPDGTAVVWTNGETGAVYLVDLTTRATKVTLPIPERGRAFQHVFSPDGKMVATSLDLGSASQVVIWLTATGDKVSHFLRQEFGSTGSVRFSPDSGRIAVVQNFANRRSEISFCEVASGKELKRFPSRVEQANFCEFSPDGLRIAVGCYLERTLVIWDTATGAEFMTLRGHTRKAVTLAFSPDGRHLASGGQDWTVRLWRVAPEE